MFIVWVNGLHILLCSRFHTISKERFKQHYENNHANSDFGFAEEYQVWLIWVAVDYLSLPAGQLPGQRYNCLELT